MTEVLQRIRDAVERLTWPARQQIEHVHGIVDELALEFDDVFAVIRDRPGEFGLSPEASAGLHDLDHRLDELSDEPSLWSEEALKTAPEWAEIRELAGEVLARL